MYQHPANFDLKYITITEYIGILRQSSSNSTDFTVVRHTTTNEQTPKQRAAVL